MMDRSKKWKSMIFRAKSIKETFSMMSNEQKVPFLSMFQETDGVLYAAEEIEALNEENKK